MATRTRAISRRTPVFGAYLRALRGDRSRGEICQRVADFGLTLDRASLLRYEAGRVTAPDPAILWALGRIYHLASIDVLLTRLVHDRTGQPLRAIHELGPAEFTTAQIRIAEIFGGLPPQAQTAVTMLTEIAAALSTASPPGRPRR